ncbi:MAG: alpha-(1-2)-phosphatidylinositol mannosyltransferase, partial [Mycobacteriaceae bacterium]
GDSVAWARALHELLVDPIRRDALAAAGSRAVSNYDWVVVAQQVMQVYETVTAGREHVHEAGG